MQPDFTICLKSGWVVVNRRLNRDSVTGALNWFHGANLTLSSDVGQDTQMFDLHERPPAYRCISSKNI